jgi:putative ABC transport system ATP-binding protein
MDKTCLMHCVFLVQAQAAWGFQVVEISLPVVSLVAVSLVAVIQVVEGPMDPAQVEEPVVGSLLRPAEVGNMTDWVIEATDLTKVYEMGEVEVQALCGVTFKIARGEMVSIMGPSGSGKSTLMNILGCLDTPTSGEYILDGENVSNMSDDDLSDIRNQKVGFVFQSFNLMPRETALANVELPLKYGGFPKRRQKAMTALEEVGLADRMDHKPLELSGGQQQRVAIARALVTEPAIIMADEPTGNLDSHSGAEIMDMLVKFNKDFGRTIIIVTHDPKVAARTPRILQLRDGLLESGG